MNKTFKIFLGIIILLAVISIILSISNNRRKEADKTTCYKKTITIWSPFEARKIKNEKIIKVLKQYCITLKAERKTLGQIKDEILPAIAAGKGPSVIYTDQDFLLKNKDIFASNPKKAWLNFKDYPISIQNSLGKEAFAYPITYDTLVLFWNKDLLNSIGHTEPAQTFEGIYEIIPQLRKLNSSGQIIVSPIALGSAQNIDSYFETFLVMMKMLNPNSKKTSSDVSKALFKTLDYYTQFVNSKSGYFSWHPNLPDQKDAFLNEQTAMIIDFYEFKKTIIKRNPRFNFEIAPLPKFEANPKKANYISPYFFAVTKDNAEISWLFLEILDTNYTDIIKDLEINSIKISSGKNLEAEEKILFNEMIVGDTFSDVNKNYIKPYLKEDIENWLVNQKDVRQLIYSKQASKFYKK